jgi:hypothetical protein
MVRFCDRSAVDFPIVHVEPIAQMWVIPQRLPPPFIGEHQRERECHVVERER